MSAIELTAYPGSILGPIAKVLGWIMNGIYDIVYHLTGVESVTISIVIITILIYTCLLPLTIKQQTKRHSVFIRSMVYHRWVAVFRC